MGNASAIEAGASTLAQNGQGQSNREIVEVDVTVPTFDTDDAVPEVDIKPDLEATEFCDQNAFFFAKMSKIVYSTKEEVQTFFRDHEATTGPAFDHFHWFEADPAVSGESILDAIHDTEAFVAANDDMIVVVFRGTSELTDWATNLNVRTRKIPTDWRCGEEDCAVHQGFDDGVNTVWDGVESMHRKILTLYEKEGKRRKLFITGHSLGGALATVAAARLAFLDDLNIAGIYTIGSPRVFDGSLAAKFDSKMNHGACLKDKYFRCRNNNDIVPRIMPPPYHHVGTEIYLDRFGAVGTTSWMDRFLGRASAYLRLSFIDGVNDHSSSEYVRLFKQLVVNSKTSLFEKAKSVVKDAAQKVIPLDKEKAEAQESEIEAAKQTALDASQKVYVPTDLPDYATEEEQNLLRTS